MKNFLAACAVAGIASWTAPAAAQTVMPEPTASPATMASPSANAPGLVAPERAAFETNATPDVYVRAGSGVVPATAAGNPGDALYNADGTSLGVTLGAWFGARGVWQSSVEDGVPTTRAQFSGLVPNGNYSLFERHMAGGSAKVTPLDGSGATNSFLASSTGKTTTTLTIAGTLVPGDVVLLVYHTDGSVHPKTIGRIGYDAHIQLRFVQK